MENSMFCYQCQETAKGTGCTRMGVCGKSAETARIQDLLIYVARGVCVASHTLRQHHFPVNSTVNRYINDALFSTITNANFCNEALLVKVREGLALRQKLLDAVEAHQLQVPHAEAVEWDGKYEEMEHRPHKIGVLSERSPEIRALKELILYGLKGMAAYLQHANRLGFDEEELQAFLQKMLAVTTTDKLSTEELVTLMLETGAHGVRAMALLDKANCSTFGNPELTEVQQQPADNPAILISGHDLRDLENLLEQTKDTGIDVYTHCEMLPANAYPAFKKYTHFRGNYGGAWWLQREEFETFNGPILLTTNCLIPPTGHVHYADRLYTTGSAGYPHCEHIEEDDFGEKDFSALIEQAKHCEPPTPIHYEDTLTIGCAHSQVEKWLPQIKEALRTGALRKMVVMAGCDGRHVSRQYYTHFAKALPKDTIILTAGCAKYRYNQLNLGCIDDIPRLMDCGQCNDSYSIVRIALMLREATGAKSLNDLPIIYNLAWYEQKSVIVLLALLSLGIKHIHLGPTLPAFATPAMLQLLSERFDLGTISEAYADMKAFVGEPELVEEMNAEEFY